MTIEAIEQAAKTIVESAYEYETALQKKDKKTSEQKKQYENSDADNACVYWAHFCTAFFSDLMNSSMSAKQTGTQARAAP